MASKIVPGNVDGTYPTAGKDNSSQGFRDNFTAIKNNFTEAKSEIEALQTNKASLNGSSDFSDNEVLRAKFKDTSESVYAHGTAGGDIVLNHTNGHYQTITSNASITLSFTNWPAAATVGRIIFDITFWTHFTYLHLVLNKSRQSFLRGIDNPLPPQIFRILLFLCLSGFTNESTDPNVADRYGRRVFLILMVFF